jgi:hypothetical protein
MRTAPLLFIALTGPAMGQGWVEHDGGFHLAFGSREITVRTPGTIEVGPRGGPMVSVAFFAWHDNWVYERLERGAVDAPPTLDARGCLVQHGRWGASDGSPPLRYVLTLEPQGEAVVARLTLEKTGAMRITNGVWCNIAYDGLPTEGRQAYLRPTAHGPLGKPIAGECEALLIDLGDGQAASFAPDRYTEARNQDWPGFEMMLRPGDFAEGERVETSLTIGFERFPTEFPGEVKPSREKLAIRGIRGSSDTVPLHGLLEIEVDLRATWDNPYDPDDVALDAEVTTASGRRYHMPGFFLLPHRSETRGDAEMMVPEGKGAWRVRLAATEPGPLRVRLTARDRSGTVTAQSGPYLVTPSDAKGFLRRSPVDAHYLQYESGAPFFPIGHNLPIYHSSGQTGEQAIRKMAASGENYNRWWMSSTGFGIEWGGPLGWYRQATAARLDAMLDLARGLDFVYMLCFDTHQDFRESGWAGNPLNSANGGPCATPAEWFTNEQARALYRKRLRYTVARWAYSPNVLCWEFGNEMEGWPDASLEDKVAWHREMSAVLAELDPYDHPITTSWWSNTGPDECWSLPGMDIVQTHCYTNNDANVAEQVRQYCLHQWEGYAKPHIFGEYGIRSHETTEDKDPEGWGLHNAYWAAMCSGACGIPMPWWHENYIDPLNLYFHFTSIRDFTRDLPFGTAPWRQVPVEAVEYVAVPGPPIARDVVLTPQAVWGKPEASEFTVAADGSVTPEGKALDLLHGAGHPDLRNPPTFVVDYPRAGTFTVRVGRVSNSGHLLIWVDDQLALERDFPCGEGLGKESAYVEEWKLWETIYDEDVSIEVPAGTHRIRVDSTGKDWMRVSRYTFSGCWVVSRPNLLVAALASPEVSIVWIQNRDSDWFNRGRGEVASIPASRVTLGGLADGDYDVEWWSTWRAAPTRTERVHAEAGRLTLKPGEIASDLAAKIRPAH